jgi:hypothetical protein
MREGGADSGAALDKLRKLDSREKQKGLES